MGLSAGLGFRIGFPTGHDVRGDILATCDCRCGLSAGHNYIFNLQQFVFAGLVFYWP
jgi:hypothetical protein